MLNSFNSILIIGPTATGKTKLAVRLAVENKGEIISLDSRQLYKGLDIGTGKDLNEYVVNGKSVPYHLIDVAEPTQRLNVFDYVNLFTKAFNDILSRGKMPVVCGGTMQYLDTLLHKNKLIAVPVNLAFRKELQQLNAGQLLERLHTYPNVNKYPIDFSSVKRMVRAIEILEYLTHNPEPEIDFPDFKPRMLLIAPDRVVVKKRISARLKQRLENGMIEEVHGLLHKGVTHDQLGYFGLEYKFLSQYLQQKITKQQLFDMLETAIHQYAKRQMTWVRKFQREGILFEEIK